MVLKTEDLPRRKEPRTRLGFATSWLHDLAWVMFSLTQIWLEAPDGLSQNLTAMSKKTLEKVKTSRGTENKGSQ